MRPILLFVARFSSVRTACRGFVSAVAEFLIADRRPITNQLSVTEFLAAGEDYFAHAAERLAVPGCIQDDGDCVARLNRISGPARGTNCRGGVCFRDPVS